MPTKALSKPAGPSLAAQPAAFTIDVNLIFLFVTFHTLHEFRAHMMPPLNSKGHKEENRSQSTSP
jgi:hypothetical protein